MASDSKPLGWFWCANDTLFPGHSNQKSWRGAWTIQVVFTGTSVSLWRWRRMATFLSSLLTFAQDQMALCAVQATGNKHIRTCMSSRSHHHSSSKQAGFAALCDRESVQDEFRFLKTTFRENGYSQKQIQCAVSPPVRTCKPQAMHLSHLPIVRPGDVHPHQQNAGQSHHQKCWSAAQEDLQLCPSFVGQPGVQDSECVQHLCKCGQG